MVDIDRKAVILIVVLLVLFLFVGTIELSIVPERSTYSQLVGNEYGTGDSQCKECCPDNSPISIAGKTISNFGWVDTSCISYDGMSDAWAWIDGIQYHSERYWKADYCSGEGTNFTSDGQIYSDDKIDVSFRNMGAPSCWWVDITLKPENHITYTVDVPGMIVEDTPDQLLNVTIDNQWKNNAMINVYLRYRFRTPWGPVAHVENKTMVMLSGSNIVSFEIPTQEVGRMYVDVQPVLLWDNPNIVELPTYEFTTIPITTRELYIFEKIQCLTDADCISPCPGVSTWCENNICMYSGKCLIPPGEENIIAKIQSFFATIWLWILSYLGWL